MVIPSTENPEFASMPKIVHSLADMDTKYIHCRLKRCMNAPENSSDCTGSLIDNVLLKLVVTHP